MKTPRPANPEIARLWGDGVLAALAAAAISLPAIRFTSRHSEKRRSGRGTRTSR